MSNVGKRSVVKGDIDWTHPLCVPTNQRAENLLCVGVFPFGPGLHVHRPQASMLLSGLCLRSCYTNVNMFIFSKVYFYVNFYFFGGGISFCG